MKNETPNTDGTVVRTHTLIFIPQQAKDKDGENLLAVPLTIILDGKEYTTTISGDLANRGNFSSGMSYECTIRFTKTGINVDESAVKDWTAGMTTEVNVSLL